MKGIDVSKHQATINWAEVKADGVEFAIVRAGFGKNNVDQYAHINLLRCNQLGIHAGIYWFSYAYTEEMARNEARYAVAVAKAHVIDFPIWFDFEYDSANYAKKHGVPMSKELFCKLTKAFCDEVESAGYYAGFYCNKDYLKQYTTPELRERYDMWLADYSTSNPSKIANLVQFTSKGRIAGVNGNCDVDVAFRDYPAVIRKAGLNNL